MLRPVGRGLCRSYRSGVRRRRRAGLRSLRGPAPVDAGEYLGNTGASGSKYPKCCGRAREAGAGHDQQSRVPAFQANAWSSKPCAASPTTAGSVQRPCVQPGQVLAGGAAVDQRAASRTGGAFRDQPSDGVFAVQRCSMANCRVRWRRGQRASSPWRGGSHRWPRIPARMAQPTRQPQARCTLDRPPKLRQGRSPASGASGSNALSS